MVDLLGAAAALWGIVMAVSPLLQIRRIVIRRSAADVSLGYLAVLQIGFALWVAYGLAAQNPVLVVPNSLAALMGAATLLATWRYRPAGSAGEHADPI
jgi:MtN3 and saliva related transmembrane protein